MILTKMKQTAEAYLGVRVRDAVITVPAPSLDPAISSTVVVTQWLCSLYNGSVVSGLRRTFPSAAFAEGVANVSSKGRFVFLAFSTLWASMRNLC